MGWSKDHGTAAKVNAEYAREQGNVAKQEATNLAELKSSVEAATQNASTAAENANSVIVDANTAASNADSAASEAFTQANHAKNEGDRAKAEADRLAGTDVSKLDNKITEVTTQLAQKVNQFSLENAMQNDYKNLVLNGNFVENKTTGWTTTGETFATSVVNNTLTIDSPVNKTFGIQYTTANSFTGNDKIFVSVKTKIQGNKLSINLRGDLSGTNQVYVGEVNLPDMNKWHTVSGVSMVSNAISGNLRLALIVTSGLKLEVKEVTVINLTSVFGAGNEPTKEQMIEIMKYYPRKFLFNSNLGQMQEDIKKLKAAVVALGGTV